MRRISILSFALLSFLWACDTKPAEEAIANTGAANFSASFECPLGVTALWEEGDKVVVVDSKNNIHRFDMDAGVSKSVADFSGTLSENSQVKYVAFSHDAGAVLYDAETEGFSLEVPSVYTAKTAGALVKANQVAIGTLQGSEVSLKSVCGFVKFTLEPNGKTLELGGRTYSLTDLRQVSFTANDGKAFAGTVHARWQEGNATPVFLDVEDGASTITFRTRQLSTPEGDIFYEAGDYYIPVIPQSYEDVTILVEDAEGNAATAVDHRALDVQAAAQSNLNVIEWPTIVVTINLQCASRAEEATYVELAALSTNGLAPDRVNNTTGLSVKGLSPIRTEIPFMASGLEHVMWTDRGVGRWTSAAVTGGGYCMSDLCFDFYNTNWSYSGEKWTVGYQNSVSWIKLPAYDGVLTKIEINDYHSSYTGAMSISSEVDPETGIGDHSVYYTPKLTGGYGSFSWDSIPVAGAKRGEQFYICMESGNTWRIRGWKLHYKVFD